MMTAHPGFPALVNTFHIAMIITSIGNIKINIIPASMAINAPIASIMPPIFS